MNPLIQIKDLDFCYGTQSILNHINLTYHSSQFLGIIGQNGGGKSTLIKLILNLIPRPKNITLALSLDAIGYVPQHSNHNPHFPVRVNEIVQMGRVAPIGLYRKADKNKTYETMERLNILDLKDRKMSDLSGGQKQKVLLARALCSDPKLLILDEPTASIDSFSTNEIFALLQTLHSQGVGIIIVCHDLSLLLHHCTHIAYLQHSLTLYQIPENQDTLIADFGCKHHIMGQCDAR
ncbi:metal ABC transporter ATP-binding protein [Helicobacter enhydrae]|nr:metal ABC transporter ATP-binding protein [Helicobacter enhydrae]